MRKGLKILEDVPGTGREACRGDIAVVNLRLFLNQGEEVTAEYPDSPRAVIDLGRRQTIADVHYGIDGMREGGRRTFTVSPHLAYGEEGLGEHIPPNAVLRCEVELLEVHDRSYLYPAKLPSGRWLSIFHPGLAADSTRRWQLTLAEGLPSGAIITTPLPDGTWRRAIRRYVPIDCNAATFERLLAEAESMPDRQPGDCLDDDQLWADHAEAANSVTRDRATDTPCVTIEVIVNRTRTRHYSMRRNSAAWRASTMRQQVEAWLGPYLRPGSRP